ncbi:hypothetical protein KP509_12G027600 [Ceratopteris richardii]|uniref:Uncharacterized protein n=1 Tax=Ceratopteris richardii TaxID=49495 RepID=A0A8T2TK69_CERRI|nr:hypothetical protein KP509_12G027600 [Ceratopteris richardii]
MKSADAGTEMPSPSSTSVQKHVQMVSKAASRKLLVKFPDLLPSGSADDGVASSSDVETPLSTGLVPVSCFKLGSRKQVFVGTQILPDQAAPPVSSRMDSTAEAFTPLLTPQRPRSQSFTPSICRTRPRFKRTARLPTLADKVMYRFMQGASKCKYRMRLHVVAKRYKLKQLVDS